MNPPLGRTNCFIIINMAFTNMKSCQEQVQKKKKKIKMARTKITKYIKCKCRLFQQTPHSKTLHIVKAHTFLLV